MEIEFFIQGIGDWGLGIGDWGLGIGDWAQSPIPNPQSPIPNPQSPIPMRFINIKLSLHYKIFNYNLKLIIINMVLIHNITY